MRRLNADQSTRKLRRGAGLDHDAPKKEKRNETRFRRWCLISPFLAFREGGTKLKLPMLLQREQDRFSYHIKPKLRSTSSCVCEYIWYSCSPFGSKTRKLQTYLPKHPLLGRTYITRNPDPLMISPNAVWNTVWSLYIQPKKEYSKYIIWPKNDETISFQIKPAQAMSSTCGNFSPSGCVGWMAVIEMFACLYIYMNMRKPVVSASLSHSRFASALFLRCAVSLYSALLVTGFWGAVPFLLDFEERWFLASMTYQYLSSSVSWEPLGVGWVYLLIYSLRFTLDVHVSTIKTSYS